MKYLILLLLFLIPTLSTAQDVSIEVMPQSIPLWGQADNYRAISASYKDVSVYYFHTTDSDPWGWEALTGNDKYSSYNSFAISYKILSIKEYFYLDVMYFERDAPIKGSSSIQFKVGLQLPINDRFSINYVHISNGFGIINHINGGMDFFSLRMNI